MRVRIVPALIVILVAIARLAPAQENEAEREKQERVADIFVALGVRDGAKVADLGSEIKEHEIAPEIVESELREAGFEIVDRDDVFTRFTRPPPRGFWLIRARRP